MKRLMTVVAPKTSPPSRQVSAQQAQDQADRTLNRKLRGGRSFRSTMVVNQWGGELDLEMLETIGEGSYGVVNRAVEKSTGRTRVVKRVVQPSHWDINKLKEEAELLQSFDHPHIVRIFAWCVNTGSIEIVMEECSGGEYLSVIRKGKNRGESLSEAWIASAFLQVFEALAYVHGKGIVHRDLKSGNLLLLQSTESENGSVFEKMPHMVVCDLGIATVYAEGFWSKCLENVSGGDLAGTPAYMAPELFKGKNATPKCDVWSMGVLLYQTYTNRLPFNIHGDSGLDQDSQNAWYDCISKGVEWSKLRASKEVKKFCAKMLSFKEAARPNALECIQDPWIRNNADQGPSTDEIRELMQALSFWKDKNPWQRAICLKLAVGCTCANRFARVFAIFDQDNSGVLSTPEIVKTLIEMGIDKHDAKTIAEHLDFNRDKTCEFLEFVAACLCSLKEEFDQMLRALFSMLDTNDDGVIDEQEMLTLQRELEPIAKAHGFELGELDNDGDGVISFREFASYFGRKGINRSSVVLTPDDEDLMRISTFMAKDVLARGRSTEEVVRVLDRQIARDSGETSRSSRASSSSSFVPREDQAMATPTATYRGTFTHPSFGSASIGIVVEMSRNQTTWTALGQSKSQTESIQIQWNGKKVRMMDSTTVLSGELVGNGVLEGSVTQSGIPGGSFRLVEETPAQVTKKKQAADKSKRAQSPKKKKAKPPQFDFDNDALSRRILEKVRQHKRHSNRESKPRCPNPLHESASDTDVTSCPESASVDNASSIALSDFDLTDLWGYDSRASCNEDNPLRMVTLGYDALPRYVAL